MRPAPARKAFGGPVLRHVLKLPTWLYRANLGWLLGKRFLQMTHRGRVTGKPHRTVVEVIGRSEAGEYVVLSGTGARADWYRNLQQTRATDISIGRAHFNPTQRFLDAHEIAQMLAAYEQRHPVLRPIVRKVLTALTGVADDGTPQTRALLAGRLTAVAFRPESAWRRQH